MNIASALLKQVVIQQDLDTWAQVKDIYLPSEYRGIFSVLEKHVDIYQSLPTFEELKTGQRDLAKRDSRASFQKAQLQPQKHTVGSNLACHGIVSLVSSIQSPRNLSRTTLTSQSAHTADSRSQLTIFSNPPVNT